LGAVKASLRRHGQYRPVVANRDGTVLAGNHVLRAACELGWDRLAVTFVDLSEEEALRVVLVDNRTSDLAGYDEELLAELLSGLGDLSGTGFDGQALDELLADVAPPLGEEGELPPPPREPTTELGDVYALGRHLLVCGDARDAAVLERATGGERAAVLWTDPPYGVGYEGKTNARLRLAGDQPAGLAELLGAAFGAADGVLAEGAAVYVAHPAGPLSLVFGAAFVGVGWRLRQTLVWVKDAFVLGHGDYHFQHEPILYGYRPGGGRRGRGHRGWYGDNAQSSVLEVPRPRASREHPTAKPVELVERCLKNSSRAGDVVLDPFAGSGSTLVACDRLRRRARLVELDPGYCDVILARWERLTGTAAEKLGGGG
jgi:DNA modification methylase